MTSSSVLLLCEISQISAASARVSLFAIWMLHVCISGDTARVAQIGIYSRAMINNKFFNPLSASAPLLSHPRARCSSFPFGLYYVLSRARAATLSYRTARIW